MLCDKSLDHSIVLISRERGCHLLIAITEAGLIMSSPNDSSALIIRGGGQAFVQSGQIDWVGFLRATAEATISVLTRLSGSGVEPLTLLVAEQLCSTIPLSKDGQKGASDALS